MKPRLFIGSSVEGLNVAYAIQQNLTYDAESTVWDQGVFELSKTTIESLTATLDNVDYGAFVFSPDDVVILRGNSSPAVRDNVLFELGLFIGKLGRDRVFFVVPDGSDIHLPTDLLGVTPGKYDPEREDKSTQAATGAVCNQIRTQIKKLGLLRPPIEGEDAASKPVESQEDSRNAWIADFVNKDYSTALKKIEAQLPNLSGDELLIEKAWHAYITTKVYEQKGRNLLLGLAETYKNKTNVFQLVLNQLAWAGYEETALELAENALTDTENDNELLVLIANFHVRLGDSDNAIGVLSGSSPENDPSLAVALIEIYKDNNQLDKALELANAAYLKTPGNESLMFAFANLLREKERNKEAAFLFNKLIDINPKSQKYWGYLSNTCLSLELYDKAMSACKKAVDLSKRKEAWLLNNVGNMLNNKGFYSDAISWLNEGMTVFSTEYGHNRLALAIKNRDDEENKFKAICLEGRKLIKSSQLPEQS